MSAALNPRWLLALLALALAFGALCPASAASVSYQGDAARFIEPEGDNLFTDFAAVMPGDTIEQTISVSVQGAQPTALYLRAQAPDPTGQAFLRQLGLTVRQGSETLSHAPADQRAGLAENRLLGVFSGGQSTTLTVTLAVPAALDNSWQNAAGTINWIFTAEEITPTSTPIATSTPTSTPTPARTPARPGHGIPATGDTLAALPLAAGSGAALAVLYLRRKHK